MDMQERIAARRAELERQRRAAGTAEDSKTDADISDVSDIFEDLLGPGKPSAGAHAVPPAEPAAAAARVQSDGNVQDRIAERRAQVERKRAEAAAANKAATDAQRAAELAVAERAWAEEARAKKAAIDQGEVPATKSRGGMDEVLRVGIGRRWTANDKLWVALLGGGGFLMLQWVPVLGVIMILIAAGLYTGRNRKYRQELQRDYPDLFGPDAG